MSASAARRAKDRKARGELIAWTYWAAGYAPPSVFRRGMTLRFVPIASGRFLLRNLRVSFTCESPPTTTPEMQRHLATQRIFVYHGQMELVVNGKQALVSPCYALPSGFTVLPSFQPPAPFPLAAGLVIEGKSLVTARISFPRKNFDGPVVKSRTHRLTIMLDGFRQRPLR